MGSQAAIPMSTSADSVNPLLSTFLCDSAPGRALREALIAFAADRGLAADALTLGDALRLLQPTPCSVPGLRDAMRARGWTQTAAATELGFTQAQLSRWLRGQASPSVGSARRIAATLGMSLVELLGEAAPSVLPLQEGFLQPTTPEAQQRLADLSLRISATRDASTRG